MWCGLRNSFGATTEKVLELNAAGNNFFVHESWSKLAHTELCTNCHARLDYGFQFFLGYPDSRASTHFIPALQATATGPLYGHDIRDPRGEAALTPLAFAKLATGEPEFTACMTEHFVSYVLGDRATADDVTAIEAAVKTTGTFKPPMKVALQLYAQKWRATEAPRAPSPVAASQPGPTGGVTVSAPLRALLDQHCVDCHDDTPYAGGADGELTAFDFRGGELPRALLVNMADKVAFGLMPKNHGLDATGRETIVTALVDALWADPVARAEAQRYYLGRERGLPAQQLDNALFAIDRAARARSNIAWGALERGLWSDQTTITPSFIAITGLAALRACEHADDPAKLDDCLRLATSWRSVSR
jgi:hypothetical protein